MASILDRYGIKEVADVTFYKIGDDGKPAAPVLFLDTLKVSTIEQTAQTADARGGKGNPKLISWDYGKEINVTIEDALFSPKSMAIMFGDGTLTGNSSAMVLKTAVIRLDSTGKLPEYFTADVMKDGEQVRTKVYVESSATTHNDGVSIANYSGLITLKSAFAEDGEQLDGDLTVEEWVAAHASATAPFASHGGEKVLVKYEQKANTNTITINGDSFPGTYYVQGDTYARSDIDGEDRFFQFIIPKAKMTAENTITLQADGDPSTFNMNLTVLRPENGEMMQLVQYDLAAPTAG